MRSEPPESDPLEQSTSASQPRPVEESPSPSAPLTPASIELGKSTIEFSLRIASPMVGTDFGRYHIEEQIGRGGMGVVYRARDTLLNRTVALKLIRSGALATEQEIERFYREARAVARFDHPHIIKIHDFGQLHGHYFFTMSLAEGSLFDRLPHFQDNLREGVALLTKLARAVHFMHENRVLHRDLKPGNVLLHGGVEPLISDFGLAKAIDPEQDLTHTGDVFGTPAYMAPEQTAGRHKEVGYHTDIWALGVMTYEIACGQRPFKGSSNKDVVSSIQSADPPRPSRMRRQVDRNLETIILKCLEKDPRRRYPSAAALADDLDRWLRGDPILARPQSFVQKTARWTWRHPALTACLTVIFAALVALPFVLAELDPEKVLKREIFPQLVAHKPVTLIGEDNDPPWREWRLPGNFGDKAHLEPRFNITAGGIGLLELLPRMPVSNFRFKAQVRQFLNSGHVGVFLCYKQHPESVHSYIRYKFADYEHPLAARGIFWIDIINYGSGYRITKIAPVTKKQFEPQLGAWRELEIAAIDGELQFFWERELIETLPLAKRLNEAANLVVPRRNLPNVKDDFSPLGGLGLYVEEGRASYRNVVIAPP